MSTRSLTLVDPVHLKAHDYCASIIKTKAHSFYFASRFLPVSKRHDVFALYAFCRVVDDIADVPQLDVPAAAIYRQLDGWRSWLLAGAPIDAGDPIKYALGHVVRVHDLPLRPLVDLVETVQQDMEPRHLESAAALDGFCYGVAGTVGIVMAALLGTREPLALDYARDLGIAMQLTNVLRDVGEDLRRGRIYLPADAMAQFDYTRQDLERGVVDERFVALMQMHIDSARRYYDRGLDGLRYLPHDSQFPIAVAARTYAGILVKIERASFDVFSQRARTRRRDKLLLAARLYATRVQL